MTEPTLLSVIAAGAVCVLGAAGMVASLNWTAITRAMAGRRTPIERTCGACVNWRHKRRAWGHCIGCGGWTKLWWSCAGFEAPGPRRAAGDGRRVYGACRPPQAPLDVFGEPLPYASDREPKP